MSITISSGADILIICVATMLIGARWLLRRALIRELVKQGSPLKEAVALANGLEYSSKSVSIDGCSIVETTVRPRR